MLPFRKPMMQRAMPLARPIWMRKDSQFFADRDMPLLKETTTSGIRLFVKHTLALIANRWNFWMVLRSLRGNMIMSAT